MQIHLGRLVLSLHGKRGGWVRWFDKRPLPFNGSWGLHLKTSRAAPMFSERNGHEKPLVRCGGWRLFVIAPEKNYK